MVSNIYCGYLKGELYHVISITTGNASVAEQVHYIWIIPVNLSLKPSKNTLGFFFLFFLVSNVFKVELSERSVIC